MTNSDRISYFAETDYRGKKIKFGIKEGDRARHMYIIGKTGMGKSTLLENLAVQDIQSGEGLCFIDPHGSSAEILLAYVPKHRIDDVVYFAPFDQEFPVALNVMEDIGFDKRALVASGLIGAFKKVWVDAWSPRMEYILNNALLALLETPDSTLLGVNRMFSDKAYRDYIVSNVTDPAVLAFWRDEYAKYSDRFATEATAAIQNKVGQFVANPLIRNIIGQPKSTFDVRKLMDEKKIFIVNLSKGRIGEGNANLIGSMLITKIYLAAMSRAEIHPTELHKFPAFYLYVDEFQSFANESFADILSEARKYKLALTIAHQYIEQMSEEVRAAVFGNVGTMISFRVGSYDAEVLEKEFAPQFTAQDIVNLGFAQIYLKLMINGVGSQPFSATTLPRPVIPEPNFVREVIERSRAQFGRPRAAVEESIRKWHEPIPGPSEDESIPKTRKYAPGERAVSPSSRTEGESPRTKSRPETRPSPERREEKTHRPFAPELAKVLAAMQGEQGDTGSQMVQKEQNGGAVSERDSQNLPSIGLSLEELQRSLPQSQKTKPAAVSLAALRSPVKKDKGATPERLSDLRAALEKIVSGSAQERQEEKHSAPSQVPKSSPESVDTEREPSPRTVAQARSELEPNNKRLIRKEAGSSRASSLPPRVVLSSDITRTHEKSSEFGTQKQGPNTPNRSAVETRFSEAPLEVPEDVLRKVLRVE